MVRKAESNDIERILELENRYFKYPRQNIDVDDFLVKVIDGKICGYIDFKTVIDEGYIGNIAVDECYRRRGIGDELLEKSIEIAKEKHLEFLTLEVRKSNIPAVNLYSKHGFKEEGILKNHYSDPKEDALVMTVRKPF